ncbi:TolC family protein [Pedobacter xixiisoli]|uniref:Outer membrane efflux protein n=1 Tax=Pedobacter xixiisoli TaxID=1476464 RepID=A0A286ACK2_9SPHI|nr:TolC family protein [Pedobacter xixiisoli]SOD19624.1 Outer membrane efflux protein [Pedobacter xixiisoli]
MTIKRLFILLLLLAANVQIHAQEDIASQINPPLLQKYVDLAKEYYPKRKMYKASELSAKAKIGTAKAGYLESLNASYFYRPSNGTILDVNNPYSINGFQFGVNLNLGLFFRTPSLVKQAREEYNSASYLTKEYDILLEIDVKERYFEYLQWFNDLKVKNQAYIDNKAASDGLRYKFEKGEVSLDVYTKAKSLTSTASSEKLLAEVNMLKAKSSLEALLGKKMEEVK